jgi:hypothetical protein
MKNLARVTSLMLCVCLGWATQARADVVVDWNGIASDTIFAAAPPRPGPTAILDFAMVHVAMHDAVQAFQSRFEPYAVSILNPAGSPIAAAAGAAHDVLAARFPSQAGTLDTLLSSYLAGLGLSGDPGLAVGHQAAMAILTLRAGDGSFPPNPEVYVGGTGPGEWRPTLPAFAPMASPWLGNVVPFTLKNSTQLTASHPPPRLSSAEYARQYNETKALGSANSTVRTQAQTELALFYSDNFLILWERTLRGIATAHVKNIGDSARLFALANISAADALITAWHDKRHWSFWRPITAIREGDSDGNPKTEGDPNWLPLLVTPPYPEYTSGANNLTGAMTRTLERLFGNKFTFTVTSTPVNQSKTYHRFSDMADDVVVVRIYQGIHFHSADAIGRRQGTRAADWAFRHSLRPLADDDDDHDDHDD